MGFNVDVQLLEMILKDNHGDVDKALDELMTMNATDILAGTAKPSEVLRGSVRLADPRLLTGVVLPRSALLLLLHRLNQLKMCAMKK